MSRLNQEQLRQALDEAWDDYRHAPRHLKHSTRKRCFVLLKELAAASSAGDNAAGVPAGERPQSLERPHQPHTVLPVLSARLAGRVYQRRRAHSA